MGRFTVQSLDDAPGYRILGQAGQGGFAIVYRARQELLDRVVALKVLSVDRVDQATMRRFQRELRLTSRLTGHPNVVTVFDTGFTRAGRPYIAMDFFEAGSLRERLEREGPFPVPDVLRIGVKMAGALAAVHAAGVLHGDLKPQNILVSRYGEPALADFGIARVVDSAEVSALGQAFTPMHAAPEVLNGKPHSAASDVYSLGSTLYQLLAGRPAFHLSADSSIASLILRVLSYDPPPITRTGVPAAVSQAIVRAMAKRPEDRYTGAVELAARFQQLQHELALPITDLVGAVPHPAPAPRPPAGPGPHLGSTVHSTTAPVPRPASAAHPATAPVPRPASVPGPGPVPGPGSAAQPASAPVSGPGPTPNPLAGPGPGPGPGTPQAPEQGSTYGPDPRSRPAVPWRRSPAGLVTSLVITGLALSAIGIGLAFATASGSGTGSTDTAARPSSTAGNPTGTAGNPSGTAGNPTDAPSPGDTGGASKTPAIDDTVIAGLRPRRLSVAADAGSHITLRWVLPEAAKPYPLVLQQEPVVTDALTPLDREATSARVFDLDPRKGYCFRVGVALSIGTVSNVAWSAPHCIRGAVTGSKGGGAGAATAPAGMSGDPDGASHG
jgi:serine/threonine protein kinase